MIAASFLVYVGVFPSIAVRFCSCYGLFVVGSAEELPDIGFAEKKSESAAAEASTEVASEEFSRESHSFEDGSSDPPVMFLVSTSVHVRGPLCLR